MFTSLPPNLADIYHARIINSIYPAKTLSSNKPSPRLIAILPINIKIIKRRLKPVPKAREMGPHAGTSRGDIEVATPRTSNILKIFDPTILPTARSASPFFLLQVLMWQAPERLYLSQQ